MRCRTLLFVGMFFAIQSLSAQDAGLDSLLRKIEQRMENYVDYDSFSAMVVSTSREMDKEWNPKEVVVVEKKVIQQREKRREVILKATEFKKGVEKDVTAEYREQERKRMEKAEKRRREREKEGGNGGEGGSLSLSSDETFPFAPEERKNFFFNQLSDTVIDGRAVICLETRAKEKSEKLYEGKYYVDRERYDVLMVDLRPSKNPKYVKEMRMKMWFDVLPENHQVLTAFWMRVYAGIFIKKIRMEVEETYKDYRIDVKETREG
jgi:hypothetical protein